MAFTNHKIVGLVDEIKETQAMVTFHEDAKDPADEILAEQFKIRKHRLLRQLLSELALSGVSFKEIKQFIQRLTGYLEKTETVNGTSADIQSNLAEVEAMLI